MNRTISTVTLLVLLLTLAALPAQAQEGAPGQEPLINERDATMEETGLGNVIQTARFHYGAGERMVKQAAKLDAKAAESPDKAEKFQEKAASLRENAIQEFKSAIGNNKNLIEAYAALGSVLRETGKADQALSVHAQALGLAPDDEANFRGWAESLMDMNLLGNATQAYTSFLESKPAQAATLMEVMKGWLAERRTDPGELAPADIERMAEWIEAQENGAG